MKAVLNKVADRMLTALGLGMDFSVDLRESFFTQITPTLYLGARPTRERVEELKGAGVTHVVSCLMDEERSQMSFLQEDFEHLFLDLHDGIDQDIAGTFSQFFDFVAAATASDPNAKLFVHCEVGVSRSPTLVIALLMKTEALSFFEALHRVRSKRFQVLPNIGFASQLQRLEHELQPHSMNRAPSSLARYLHGVCNAPVELEVLQSALERHRYDALTSLEMIFGDEIPRVIQGVRLARKPWR
jgi:protein-tyrosine phosphatase